MPNGLPDTHQYSSAHDLAVLSQAIWRDFPQYYHYFQTAGFTYRNRYATNAGNERSTLTSANAYGVGLASTSRVANVDIIIAGGKVGPG